MPPAGSGGPFVDVTAASGIDFRHYNGWTGLRYIAEIMGSGGGFLDHDQDGDPDLLLLDGAPFPGFPAPDPPPRTRLYRNDGAGRFEDVTRGAGLDHPGFAMGMAVGDVDGDGAPDLYVTHFGPDVLYRNRGDGTFEDITDRAGIDDPRWTASATFFDAEGDGDLDLYVTGYLDFSVERHEPCSVGGVPIHCGPDAYGPIDDRLYRNDGTGRFEDAAAAAGIAGLGGKGLGVVAGDLDDDGDQDLYVANDATPNFLFVNDSCDGQLRFREEAVFYGAAYGESAQAQAGMGVDLGDYDGDGDPDIVCTNLDNQGNSLYRNDGGTAMMESSYATGLAAPSLPWVGFGVRFLDFDTDADLDLFVANGHIMDTVGLVRQGGRFAQDAQLFENDGSRFREVRPGALARRVGRALATADVDGDGDLDVLITNNGDAPALLRNDAPRRGDAIGLRLEGAPPRSNRDAYGSRVVWEAFGARHVREVRAGGSYLASHDPRLLLAVDPGTPRTAVGIRWPDGAEETHDLTPGAYHHVRQGAGVVGRTPFR
jgi:hypothetical protein